MRAFLRAFLLVPFLAMPSVAAEIKVMAANALNVAARAIAADFTKETGHPIAFAFGTPGPLQQRFAAGEAADLVILPIAAMAAAEEAGRLRPGTRRSLARVGIGVAARQGSAMPDLSSVDALKRSLLAAPSLTFSDTSTGGLSGLSVARVLANLGLADAIKAKAKTLPQAEGQALIGKGEIALGLYNVSEIPRAPGVVLAGPVPAAVQAYIVYDAAVPAGVADPAPALAFLAFLASPPEREHWTKAGLELVGE